MPVSVARAFLAALLAAGSVAACDNKPKTPSWPAPVLPQVSGTLSVAGLNAAVTVVRDRYGVPHIAAGNADDLFFAQGFVQAQDRLFQMDLWRRSVQGRLAEVLGANFLERDTMTRRIQYRGDVSTDWAAYGAETQRIATAFTRGINAWVAQARVNPPEEFRLAGWLPESWRPEDLLNRTDAFLSSTSAQEEVLRARLTAALGAPAADALWPPPAGLKTAVPPGVDLSAIGFVMSDLLRRVGTRPFFSGLAAAVPPGSNTWVVDGSRTRAGAPLLAVDPHRLLEHPSGRYLVHLSAPGWNVIGATSPWLPGVVIGHNENVAWGMAAAPADIADIAVERLDPADDHRVDDRGTFVPVGVQADALAIKGRTEPWTFDWQFTPRGVIVGVDRERHLAYSLRWTGAEPGTAAELHALQLDRVASAAEFGAALKNWRLPVVDIVYADRAGAVRASRAGWVPIRTGGNGLLPAAAGDAQREWSGWESRTDQPATSSSPFLAFANDARARMARLRERLSSSARHDRESMQALQLDVHSWTADQIVPLLGAVRAPEPAVEALRLELTNWDRQVTVDSEAAAVYVAWEQALRRQLAARRVSPEFVNELAARLDIVSALTRPSASWFDGRVVAARNALLLDALAAVARDRDRWRPASTGLQASPIGEWGATHQITFSHPLGIGEAGRGRYNVGPFPLPGAPDTVFATSLDGRVGPSFRAVFDLSDWDRAVVTNAPGQSGSAGSPHFSDLAKMWSNGEYFPLYFSETAVKANAESTLTLVPSPQPPSP